MGIYEYENKITFFWQLLNQIWKRVDGSNAIDDQPT